MAIDYSKWDKIEISDDSDIEVHPNVDKKSFIRWKQQDIHQKRIQRNQDIHTFEIQIPMYEELNKRVNQLLKENSDEKLSDFEGIKKYLNATFDNSKPNGVEEDASTYNEMIEDLFIQLKEQLEKSSQNPNDGASLRFQIVNHVKKIDDVLAQQKEKLVELYKERDLHISSEDIHTGFDRSFLNKGESPVEKPQTLKTSAPSKVTAPTTQNKSSTSSSEKVSTSLPVEPSIHEESSLDKPQNIITQQEEHEKEDESYEIDELQPDTLHFSQFSTSDTAGFTKFLKQHPFIITVKQKDALIMKAFDAELAGDSKRSQQVVFFSTLLQYIRDIIDFKKATKLAELSIIVEQFCSKLFGNSSNNPLLSTFITEVDNTFKHIKSRCEYLAQESAQEGEQEIQLKSLDNNSKLIVTLPDPDSKDPEQLRKLELFNSLPTKMQKALRTESLDEVNNVFHGMPIDEAEHILSIFEEGEIIGLQAVLENEQDWNELKDEYNKFQEEEGEKLESQEEEKPKIEELSIDDHHQTYIDSNDIVD